MNTNEEPLFPGRTITPGRQWPDPSLRVGESAPMPMAVAGPVCGDEKDRQVAQVLLDHARREGVRMWVTRTGPNLQARLWDRDRRGRRKAYFFDITITGRHGGSAVIPTSCGTRGLGPDGHPDAGEWLHGMCQDAHLASDGPDGEAWADLLAAVLGWDLAAEYDNACEAAGAVEPR